MHPIEIVEVAERAPELVDALVTLWESSVRATHDFLTPEEIEKIKVFVAPGLREVPLLTIAQRNGRTLAFMGVAEGRIEMLFVSPDARGTGIGRQLAEYGFENLAVTKVTVNEQNPQAIGFYERMGFKTVKRADLDEQGNPYPLLHMER